MIPRYSMYCRCSDHYIERYKNNCINHVDHHHHHHHSSFATATVGTGSRKRRRCCYGQQQQQQQQQQVDARSDNSDAGNVSTYDYCYPYPSDVIAVTWYLLLLLTVVYFVPESWNTLGTTPVHGYNNPSYRSIQQQQHHPTALNYYKYRQNGNHPCSSKSSGSSRSNHYSIHSMWHRHRHRHRPYHPNHPNQKSTTRTRHFVLTTPEAIIEQASTTKLLDDLIDESVRTSARRPLMMQFDPSSGWIWKRWKGTVFSETWDACVYRMIYACIIFILCKSFPQTKELLSGFSILWGQLLSVTTFTLTFFVNQSYALWRKCSELSRSLQGRLHDMDMTLAAHATRMPSKNPSEPSKFTNESRQILEVVSRYVRLFNLLTYASFTRSHRPVLTPRGMRRLVERGLMTPLEREVLINAKLPATQRHNAVLLWIIRTFIEGTKAGHFTGGAGFEQQFIEKAHVCRAAYGTIGDELQGRMPLAYAHIVQVLVDLVLALYPFMAYSSGMSGFVCVIGTGLLTIGYQGLVWFSTINIIRSYEIEHYSSQIDLPNYFSQADLAKQFLDPYDNENYGKGEDPLVVDTLIAETNAGSTRWMDGLAEMPVASQKIIDGDLSEYILPRRGYTVEELQQMLEEQKIQKEKREREELERQKRKEQEEREKGWAEAMIPALMIDDDNNNNVTSTVVWHPYIELHEMDEQNVEMEGSLLASTMSMAETVNALTFSQNSNATSLQRDLVPEGTAPYISTIKKKKTSVNETVVSSDIPLLEVSNTEPTVIVDVVTDKNSHNEMPAQHEAAPPVVTDHVMELTLAHEKDDVDIVQNDIVEEVTVESVASPPIARTNDEPPPNTIEYYQQKIQEILQARREEDLRLTTAVVMSAPGAEIIVVDDDEDITPNLSEIDGNATSSDLTDNEGEADESKTEPDIDILLTIEEILEAEKQELWETQAILNARPGADSIEVLEEEVDLLTVSKVLNSTISDRMTAGSTEIFSRTNTTEFNSVSNMVLDIEKESMDDKFDTDIPIENDRVELLETEAILNAPPGANSIDVSEVDLLVIRAVNHTNDDDLAILEMDDIDEDPADPGVGPELQDVVNGSDDDAVANVIDNIADVVVRQPVPFANASDNSRLELR